MKCRKPVSTPCHEVIPWGGLTALDFDADIPTAVGTAKVPGVLRSFMTDYN